MDDGDNSWRAPPNKGNKSPICTVLCTQILREEGKRGGGGPKARCTVPQLNKSMKINKSMSKILIKVES